MFHPESLDDFDDELDINELSPANTENDAPDVPVHEEVLEEAPVEHVIEQPAE